MHQAHYELYYYATVNCRNLSDPDNGQVTLTGIVYNSIARYSCDHGYILDGDPLLTCQADGNWSGSPLCRRMLQLMMLDNGFT